MKRWITLTAFTALAFAAELSPMLPAMGGSLAWAESETVKKPRENEEESPYFQQGKKLVEEERYGEALEEFRKVLLRNKNYEKTHYYMAQCYRSLGRFNDAIESLKETIRINPLNVDARLELGSLLRSRVRFDEAIQEYKAATTLVSDAPGPYLALGEIYRETGNLEESIKSFQKLLELEPDNAKGHFQLGGLVYQQYTKPTTEQVAQFREMEPGALLRMAMDHFQKALEHDPKLPDTYIWLASLYSSQGRFDDALSLIEKGLVLQNSVALRLKLAEVLFNQGELDKAQAEIDGVLRKEEENEEAKDLKKRIQNRQAQLKQQEQR